MSRHCLDQDDFDDINNFKGIYFLEQKTVRSFPGSIGIDLCTGT